MVEFAKSVNRGVRSLMRDGCARRVIRCGLERQNHP